MNKLLSFILIACLLLAGCVSSQTAPGQAETPTSSQVTSTPGETGTGATAIPPAPTGTPMPTGLVPTETTGAVPPTPELPTSQREFSSLLDAGQMSLFPLVTPGYVPGDLPLSKITANYYADGHEELFLSYTVPTDTLDANNKLLIVTLSNATEPVSRERLARSGKASALDIQDVTVNGQAGYLYWSPAVAAGNSAHLVWRTGELNIHLMLYGDWPAPDEQQPHRLDSLLLQIAGSFQAAAYLPTTTPLPSGWQMVQAMGGQVTFALPPGWKAAGQNTYRGPDGSARLEILNASGASTGQACEWEANAHPDVYGENPALLDLPQKANEASFNTDACLIAQTGGKPSAVVLPNPKVSVKDRFLILRLVTPEAVDIALSLRVSVDLPVQPTLSGPSYNTPLGTVQPSETISPTVTHWDALSIEEFPIISATVDAPGAMEFNRRIPNSVLENREALRQAGQGQSRNSAKIGEKVYRLSETWVVTSFGGQSQAQVTLDGKVVYHYNLLPYGGSTRIYRLGTDGQHWILEVNGMLVVDGKIINQEMGYEEVFDWSILNGKPFYFYSQAGKTYLSYGGQVLPVVYDHVFHKACCEPAMFNVGSSAAMVWFYALKGGVWYYVEIGDF